MKTITNIRWQFDDRGRFIGIIGGILLALALWVAIIAAVMALL